MLTVPPIEHLLEAGARHAASMVSTSCDGSVEPCRETPEDAKEGATPK